MNKFIAFSFLVLGVGFYELSGGAEFTPETREAAHQVARAQTNETVAPALPAAKPDTVEAAAAAAPQTAEPSDIQLASFQAEEPKNTLPKIDLSKFAAPVVTEPVVQQPEASTGFIGTDIRQVIGNSVNVRSGPGTNFDVVAQAIRGEEAEVIVDDGSGWVQLRLAGGQTGWMADFLLSN